MSVVLIKDFLQTQGLKLPVDEVRASYLAAEAVMNMGVAAIDKSVLWCEADDVRLADYLVDGEETEAALKRIFMALDSVYSRASGVRSVVVYGHIQSEEGGLLVRVAQQGEPLERLLSVNEENSGVFLAGRTAQSAWMNVVRDVKYWLELGELSGGRNQNSAAQFSIPVCTAGGSVAGVLHVEFNDAAKADDGALSEWVALALAVSESLQTVLGITQDTAEENHV